MEQPGTSGRSPVTWTVAAVLLGLGILGPLLVPIYARTSPMLGAWPFFYWYQILWVPITAILVSAAYLVLRQPDAGNGNGASGTAPDLTGTGGTGAGR